MLPASTIIGPDAPTQNQNMDAVPMLFFASPVGAAVMGLLLRCHGPRHGEGRLVNRLGREEDTCFDSGCLQTVSDDRPCFGPVSAICNAQICRLWTHDRPLWMVVGRR